MNPYIVTLSISLFVRARDRDEAEQNAWDQYWDGNEYPTVADVLAISEEAAASYEEA